MNILQCGMGYVGLTGAVHMAMNGHTVYCYDVSPEVISALRQGTPKAGEFLEYLQADVAKLIDQELLIPVHSLADVWGVDFDAFLLSVPTEKDDYPYMDIVFGLVPELMAHFKRKMWKPLFIIESTVTPGTSKELVEKMAGLGYHLDHNYYLAIAPRRDWFASADKSLGNLPRAVGGASEESSYRAISVLSGVCTHIQGCTADEAELVKSVENALLNVQLAFIEHLAITYGRRVDVNRVIELATTHWRLSPLHLGSGIAGRCIPLSIRYLNDGLDLDSKEMIPGFLGDVADQDCLYRWEITHATQKKIEAIATKKAAHGDVYDVRVGIIGMGYRRDFRDLGGSPGIDFYKRIYAGLLHAEDHRPDSLKHVTLGICDPLFTAEETQKLKLNVFRYQDGWDVLLLAAPHSSIVADFPLITLFGKKGGVVIDTFGIWQSHKEELAEKGIEYIRVGQKGWVPNED